ncbi:MAG TPA: hypothetical protein VFT64_07335 [Rickettsiales bacterium]|nr:hypothetical protein [Rickettsiales bacterium]
MVFLTTQAIKRDSELMLEKIYEQYALCVSDFDGVQGFTEGLQMEAYLTIIKKHAGVEVAIADIAPRLIGNTAVHNLTVLREEYKLTPPVTELVQERETIFLESVFSTGLKPNAVVHGICREFAERGKMKPVIVSNNMQPVIEAILAFWGTRDLFSALHTSDNFPNQSLPIAERKLDFLLNHLPAMYGAKPEQILVLEDSVNTCRKAEEACMAVGFVKHGLNMPFTPKTGIVIEG